VPLDQSFVGRSYPASDPYEVGREKIREFADAIGDPNPVFRDADAAKAAGHPDVIAPPTFPILISMKAQRVVVLDPELGLDYSRVVHGEQGFHHHRPIRAGDRLVAIVHVDGIRVAAGNDMMTTRTEIMTEDGEPVVTAMATLVARGTAEAGGRSEAGATAETSTAETSTAESAEAAKNAGVAENTGAAEAQGTLEDTAKEA
jgi:acyl dehydratase